MYLQLYHYKRCWYTIMIKTLQYSHCLYCLDMSHVQFQQETFTACISLHTNSSLWKVYFLRNCNFICCFTELHFMDWSTALHFNEKKKKQHTHKKPMYLFGQSSYIHFHFKLGMKINHWFACLFSTALSQQSLHYKNFSCNQACFIYKVMFMSMFLGFV